MSHDLAASAANPGCADAKLAARSWLQTACTHAQTHESPGLIWSEASQPEAVPALF